MQFRPKTEEEIDRESVLPDGEYEFEITHAVEKTSKSGNAMIEITLRVFLEDGSYREMRDYLMDAFARKLRNFCTAFGLQERYAEGVVTAEDCFVTGRVKLGFKKAKGEYGPGNTILSYHGNEDQLPPTQHTPPAQRPALDDLPF